MKCPPGDQAAARQALAQTAVIIPVYAAPHLDLEHLQVTLNDTVAACLEQGVPPDNVCLSIDGGEPGRKLGESLAADYKVAMTSAADNSGKLAAVRNGAARLQANDRWQLLAVIDQDGDHFANDLLNLARMANHLRAADGKRRMMVLGERLSRHRPMGFLRGELEELADRILLDALMYNAAVSGRPLALEYQTHLGEFPDFHSGFKMFDRATALDVLVAEPRLCGASPDAYYRHAVEAVMTVEALALGAVLAGVNRRTVNQQVLTTFGVMDRCRLTADKIIWPLRRLAVPVRFATQWLKNHLGRLALHTLMPQGRQELNQIADLIMEDLGDKQEPPVRCPQVPFV